MECSKVSEPNLDFLQVSLAVLHHLVTRRASAIFQIKNLFRFFQR